MKNQFKKAEDAFDYYYDYISEYGHSFGNTNAIFNVGFTITEPLNNDIVLGYRNFNRDYAEAEWKWYLSGDPNVDMLGAIHGFVPKVWKRMVDENNEVRSNYGWQWERSQQLSKVVEMLKNNPETRQAVISIYDGKEMDTYDHDTPCTYAISFTIVAGKLNMSALMRSNDLWFGFCNDQYCFSKLQDMVARSLGIPVGTYYHHATNLHIYDNFLGRKPQITII